MRYWLTLHWPPRKGPWTPDPNRIYVVDGKQAAGQDLQPGDLVLIYQTKQGDTIIRPQANGDTRRVVCQKGRGGVIKFALVTGALEKQGDYAPEDYDDGQTRWWCWQAPVRVLSSAGFVPGSEVRRILNRGKMLGWGTLRSGLGPITHTQFEALRQAFVSRIHGESPAPCSPSHRFGTGEESPEHRALKEYVAHHPNEALGEPGFAHIATEYLFPTCDKADVVLQDQFGRICGVEIEVHLGDGHVEGLLQALKYRAMLECFWNRPKGEGRAILVAYSISPTMRARAERYGVECFEIDPRTVQAREVGSHART